MPRAPKLVRLLIAGAVGALPQSRCSDITDVLAAMLKACFSPVVTCSLDAIHAHLMTVRDASQPAGYVLGCSLKLHRV